MRDMNGKRAVYASRANGRHGALAATDCKLPAISANGRYVAFASKAKNLSRIDKDNVEDVFVRDLKTNRTLLVSRGQGKHGAPGSGDSSSPSISADGRYVAFESYASNLGPADNSTIPDVFVRDMRSGRVFLASRANGGGAGGERALGQSVDLGRRPLRRLRLARLEPEPRGHAARDQRLPLPAPSLTVIAQVRLLGTG